MKFWTGGGGGSICTAYMDFMKAFDKVPHGRLLKKESYGINGHILKWIEGFLIGRQQQVVVNGSTSKWHPVSSGIPQGSVLGPILFVVYINDLPECGNSNVYFFADDTKMFREIIGATDLETFQKDINELSGWSQKWLLHFHPDKCKIMFIGNPTDKKELYIPNSRDPIKEVTEEKDLGVIIVNKLIFRNDITQNYGDHQSPPGHTQFQHAL